MRSSRWLWIPCVLVSCKGGVPHSPAQPPACDVWIAGGTVVDGTGAPPRRADVMLNGDRIVYVGPPPTGAVTAGERIDASGRVVTPGFLDPHAHGDPRRTPGFANFVAMGVTTICLGQDGSSPGGKDLPGWMAMVERGRTAPNLAVLVGHGTLRRSLGIGRATTPTEAQLVAMEGRIEAAMRAGALGLSTGLEYEPGRFAGAAELARVAKAVAAHGGLVMSHVRSEDDDAIEASLRELLTQCAAAGCRAHVSHLKIVYGRGAARAHEILELLAEARRQGQRVSADVYPYLASYTGIGIVFPPWARVGEGYAEVVRTRGDELASYLRRRVEQRNGPAATLLGTGPWRGKTLADVAAATGKPFERVLMEDLGPSGTSAAYFVMRPEVMETLLVAAGVVVSSDGSPTMRHPRGHGAFAKIIRKFVVEDRRLTLAAAVHKMSGATAEILGLRDRGVLRAGAAADVLVFDPAAIRDPADYENPYRPAVGMHRVIVNGQTVWMDGVATDARPGKVLRRGVPR